MNNQNNKAYEHGYVVLPVEEYTKTLNELHALRSIVSLTETYGGQVGVQFDSFKVYELAKKLYEASHYNTPDRELKPPKSFNVWTADLTDVVQSAEANEETAAEG